MATREQLKKAVAAFGGSIDWENSYVAPSEKYLIIDAPDGHIWDDSESSVIVMSWYSGPANEFYDEAIDRVLCGTSKAH